MHNNWVLGGGIASGKSVVRSLLESQGVPVIDADSIGHNVLEPGGPAFADVADRWPQVVEDGTIERSRLGEIVFAESQELAALESITHPYIFDEIASRVEEIGSGVVVEMPLLDKRPGSDWCLMVVDSRDEIRLRRANDRGMAETDAIARMTAQPSRSEWLAAADAVIPNHGSVQELGSTVSRVVQEL